MTTEEERMERYRKFLVDQVLFSIPDGYYRLVMWNSEDGMHLSEPLSNNSYVKGIEDDPDFVGVVSHTDVDEMYVLYGGIYVKDPDADELTYVTEDGEFSAEEIVEDMTDGRELEGVEEIIDIITGKIEKRKEG